MDTVYPIFPIVKNRTYNIVNSEATPIRRMAALLYPLSQGGAP